MKLNRILLTCILLFGAGFLSMNAQPAKNVSVYQKKPNDPEAFFFTPENFNIKADGKMDVSDALQKVINQVKTEKNFGILFIPEGKYLISKTIYIPGSIRVIGYGVNRPEIILGKNTPGFQKPDSGSRYQEKYMIFFSGGIVAEGRQPTDASAGTFYSALSNIDFRIEDGNPAAVAMRCHYAQHGFISHVIFNIGKGKAGISEVGNELEDLIFLGGDYGIISGQTSPGWPPAFSGFGGPKPLLKSSEGGDDILNGIGLCTGGYNYRAVACKWMAGEKSYMNDVKFVGGHGTLSRPVVRMVICMLQMARFSYTIKMAKKLKG